MPIVDSVGRVIAVLAGRPNADPSWGRVASDAAEALNDARRKLRLRDSSHRRGNFSALTVGVSFGGGQPKPQNLVHSDARRAVLRQLLEHNSFQRISGFSNGAFGLWAPGVRQHYSETLGLLYKHDSTLERNFSNSIWPVATFNLGPKTVCAEHRDHLNLPFGFCSITALGKFDATRGGHLVLKECKLVTEFPSGSTILIPSACITHANTPIQEGETRYSFTQFAGGGLFRWVEHGFQCEESFQGGMTEDECQLEQEKRAERRAGGLRLLSKLKDLRHQGVGVDA